MPFTVFSARTVAALVRICIESRMLWAITGIITFSSSCPCSDAMATVVSEKTVKGIEANEAMCSYWVERSAALATALMPHIGYAKAAELSKQSVKEGVLIRDMVKRDKLLPAEKIDDVLDLRKMTEIGVPGGAKGPMSAGG